MSQSFFITRFFWLVCAVVFGGAIGEACAGWWVADWRVLQTNTSTGTQTTQTTSTVSTIEVIPVEPRPIPSSYPAFVSRRLSSVVPLMRAGVKNTKTASLGSAVAITNDGWLLSSHALWRDGLRLADIEGVWGGERYPIKRAIRDVSTDLVYLKMDVSGLPVASFVHPGEVSNGAAVWIEPYPERFHPELVVDIRLGLTEPLSSEQGSRRFMLTESDLAGQVVGSPVWDAQGRLVGLIEEKSVSGWMVAPVGSVVSALPMVVGNGVIHHGKLGVLTVDLAALSAIGLSVPALPHQGAWISSDRRTGSVADVLSPAVGRLIPGDVIERVERDILSGRADLGERLLDYRPGTAVTFYGVRNGEPFQTTVTLPSVTSSELLK